MKENIFVKYSPTIIGVDVKRIRRRHMKNLDWEQFQKLKTMTFLVTDDGIVYINISSSARIFVGAFISMGNSTTTQLIDALNAAKKMYPNIKTVDDIATLSDAEQEVDAILKLLIPYELERREKELAYHRQNN